MLYDSKDLVTHAVVVGMTGSGKTGLCIDLIEEAAIDGIPSILIDPKGDLANLMLTFPQLRGQDFQPWVNEEDASKKGLSVPDFAAQQAEFWKKGLGDWGESGDRIQRLRDAAEFMIYTPGSSAGVPISILKSFAVPPPEIMEDGELFQGRINTTVSSLLGLAGVDADPLQSREHILLATIMGQSWKQGHDLDLAGLIQQVQNPPVTRIGVLDLESFYPSKERFGLVMSLNNLLASPSFGAWLEGVPLDIAGILHTPQGKPRVAIFSIAHLSDSERMFFVSLLLNQILGWMRTQPGTSSLRALVYMDEIFGYFPPVQNPPSKLPLLTLLKQARAFGVGIMLATQNPVDLDYKGLSNAGTWFVGRLQAERDKARLMDGLEGAAASTGTNFDRARMDQIIVGPGQPGLPDEQHQARCSRYFPDALEHVVSARALDPGPDQDVDRSDPRQRGSAGPGRGARSNRPGSRGSAVPRLQPAPTAAAATAGLQPTLPPDIQQFFVPVRGRAGAGQSLIYQPMLLGAAKVRFLDAKAKVDETQTIMCTTPITDQAVPVSWDDGEEAGFSLEDLEKVPVARRAVRRSGAGCGQVQELHGLGPRVCELAVRPAEDRTAAQPQHRAGRARRRIGARLPGAAPAGVPRAARYHAGGPAAEVRAKNRGRAGESAARRRRGGSRGIAGEDGRHADSHLVWRHRPRRPAGGQAAVPDQRGTIGRATSAAKGVGRSMQQQQDVGRAKDTLQTYQQQLKELEDQFSQATTDLQVKIDPQNEAFETVTIRPKKTDVTVQVVALLWAPYWQDALGNTSQAW